MTALNVVQRLWRATRVGVALVLLGSPAAAQRNTDSLRKSLNTKVDSMNQAGTGAHATCHRPDAISTQMVAELTKLSARTDSLSWPLAHSMGIPEVAASEVSYITDDAICDKAAAIYDVATASNPLVAPSGALYLVRVGSVYVVWDPAKLMGEYRQVVVLSDRFEFVSANMM